MLRPSNVGKKFDFNENGSGVVIHEAKVDYKYWSPVIQVLKFTDNEHKGDIELRFGYCNVDGTLTARPLYLSENQLSDLGKEAAKEPEVRKMLMKLIQHIK